MKRLVAYTGLQLENTDVTTSSKRTVLVVVRIVILRIKIIVRLNLARVRSRVD